MANQNPYATTRVTNPYDGDAMAVSAADRKKFLDAVSGKTEANRLSNPPSAKKDGMIGTIADYVPAGVGILIGVPVGQAVTNFVEDEVVNRINSQLGEGVFFVGALGTLALGASVSMGGKRKKGVEGAIRGAVMPMSFAAATIMLQRLVDRTNFLGLGGTAAAVEAAVLPSPAEAPPVEGDQAMEGGLMIPPPGMNGSLHIRHDMNGGLFIDQGRIGNPAIMVNRGPSTIPGASAMSGYAMTQHPYSSFE